MSEDIQLEDGIVQGVEVEVGGHNIGVDIICRMLNRREIKHLIIIWHNNHAARMLTG